MAIYNENIDANIEDVESNKRKELIKEINDIIEEYGSFSLGEIDADHSPLFGEMGRVKLFAEEFNKNEATVFGYGYGDQVISESKEPYEIFGTESLEDILEMCQVWEKQNQEDEA